MLRVLPVLLAACAAPVDGQLLRASATMEVEGAVVHDVVYVSDGLRITGVVAVPDTPGPHPLVWFNHGGFHGMKDREIEDIGRRAAETNAVVAASMYRGEQGSEGQIEYCLGEVTDVWNLRPAVEQLAPVQGPGVAIGSSHGACISLMLNARAQEAGTPLAGTVALGTPSDVDTLIAWHYDEGDAQHAARWEPYLRGPENRDMSPRFAEVAPPIVLLHGLEDTIVPPEQACLMQEAVAPPWPTRTHQVDAAGNQPTGSGAACLGALDDGNPWAQLPDGLRLIGLEDTPHTPTPWAWNAAWAEVSNVLTSHSSAQRK